MFDGTDLSMAYGSMYETPMAPPPQVSTQPAHTADLPLPKSTASHATPPEQTYAPPMAMYATQPAAKLPPAYGDNFWDKLVSKKWEVIKLVMLSLVVLLGISMDKVATHYLSAYVGKAFLTETQEFLVRLSYPVVVILVIWIIKATA